MDIELDNFKEIKAERELNQATMNNFDKLFVVLFYADWHEPSKHLISILKSQSRLHPNCFFSYVDVDSTDLAPLIEKLKIEVAPTIIIMNGNKEHLCRLENASPQQLSEKIVEYEKAHRVSFELKRNEMFEKIEKILAQWPVMVFMKGSPDHPKCGFSTKMVELLRDLKIRFGHFDIIADEEVRNWLRHYAKWNTYPQVWVNGKLVGGLDVATAQVKEGKFQELIKDLDIKEDNETRATRLIGSGVVVAFIEGIPSAPKNEESKKLVEFLKEEGVKFRSFDVTAPTETELIAVLKQKLNVQTFPQVVVNKNLVDWNDLITNKKIDQVIPSTEFQQTIKKKLEALINQMPVMLFMKGSPTHPECGFSRRIVATLNKYSASFGHFNILVDQEVREQLKEYSNWRTYPQLYVDGKLVGGIDIVDQLDEMDQFQPMVEKYQI